VGGSTSTTGVGSSTSNASVGCSTSTTGVGCSTSTTSGGTGVWGSQQAVAGTEVRRDRRRRRVGVGIIRFYIFIFLSLLCNMFLCLKNAKSKKCVVPLEPPLMQTDARSILTIWTDANGRAGIF
jgi:hypothetical protein